MVTSGSAVRSRRSLRSAARASVAENPHDFGQRFAVRRGLLDQLGHHDLPGLGVPAQIRRHQDVLIDALVLGDQEPDAAILVEPPDDFAVGAREHVDDRAFGPAAAVNAGRPHRDAIAVQGPAHLCGRQEDVGATIVGHEKAIAIWMALHRSADQVELGDDTQRSLAIGHQLTVALHRCESSRERFALRDAMHVERGHKIFGTHRHAVLAQMFDDPLARRDVDRGSPAARPSLGTRGPVHRFERFGRIGRIGHRAIALCAGWFL